MSKSSDLGICGVDSRILHPKQSNRFVVRWNAVLPSHFSEQEINEARALFHGLSMQVVSIDVPIETFDTLKARVATPSEFSLVAHSGIASFVFEDDATNVVTRGIDLLRWCENITALVMKLDGNENVLEAHLLTNLSPQTLTHGALNYATGRAIYKTLSVKLLHMARTSALKPMTINEMVAHVFGG